MRRIWTCDGSAQQKRQSRVVTSSSQIRRYENDGFIASLVTIRSGTIQTQWYTVLVHTSTVAGFPSQTVLAGRYTELLSQAQIRYAALSFKIFSASDPERLHSISYSFALFFVLLPSFSFTKKKGATIIIDYFEQVRAYMAARVCCQFVSRPASDSVFRFVRIQGLVRLLTKPNLT